MYYSNGENLLSEQGFGTAFNGGRSKQKHHHIGLVVLNFLFQTSEMQQGYVEVYISAPGNHSSFCYLEVKMYYLQSLKMCKEIPSIPILNNL